MVLTKDKANTIVNQNNLPLKVPWDKFNVQLFKFSIEKEDSK